jgi:hypothetical protein
MKCNIDKVQYCRLFISVTSVKGKYTNLRRAFASWSSLEPKNSYSNRTQHSHFFTDNQMKWISCNIRDTDQKISFIISQTIYCLIEL